MISGPSTIKPIPSVLLHSAREPWPTAPDVWFDHAAGVILLRKTYRLAVPQLTRNASDPSFEVKTPRNRPLIQFLSDPVGFCWPDWPSPAIFAPTHLQLVVSGVLRRSPAVRDEGERVAP